MGQVVANDMIGNAGDLLFLSIVRLANGRSVLMLCLTRVSVRHCCVLF